MSDYLDIAQSKRQRKNYLYSDNETLFARRRLGHGVLSKEGPLCRNWLLHWACRKDKYVVKNSETEKTIWWENSLNPMTEETFNSYR